MRPTHWKGRWQGQAQKWFALAFTGRDFDIDIAAHDHEFDAWQWLPARQMLDRIVPFKRPVYEAVLKEFADLVDVSSGALTPLARRTWSRCGAGTTGRRGSSRRFSQPCGCRPTAFNTIAMARWTWLSR